MATPKEQFLLEEAVATRELIRNSIAEARALERYCLAATAGVWSWLLTRVQSETVVLGYWIPFIFAVLALLRVIALYLDIQIAAKYQREVEAAFLSAETPEGWERRRNPRGKMRRPVAAALFWGLLILVTFLVPALLRFSVA